MNDSLKTRSDISVILLFFSLLAVLGVIGAGFIVNDYSRARASTAWPIYEGIVLAPGANDDFRYVYSVNGRSYESRRRQFFSKGVTGGNVDFGPGEIVNVYVNPEDSDFSVLRTGGSGVLFTIFSVLFGAFVFFGVGGVVRTLAHAAPEGGERPETNSQGAEFLS